MSLSDRQRIQGLLLEALFKARERVKELDAALAYNSALLGIGVDRHAGLGAPPPELGSLSSVMKYLQLDPGEADISDYLGIEGDDLTRPRLPDDAPAALKPKNEPQISPNIGQVAMEHDSDDLLAFMPAGDIPLILPEADPRSGESSVLPFAAASSLVPADPSMDIPAVPAGFHLNASMDMSFAPAGLPFDLSVEEASSVSAVPSDRPKDTVFVSSDHVCRESIEAFLPLTVRLPVLDVRSPVEYAKAHVPGAVNLPLFDDAGRAEIGRLYKQVGTEAAMLRALGHIGPRMEMLARTALDLCSGPAEGGGTPRREAAVYCARGGMRSASAAWLLETMGIRAHVLEGGYKAFRRFALEFLNRPHALQVLGGKTGSGKTRVLAELARRGMPVVDLEGLARHRGSAFGALPEPQPSTEQFENCLASALLCLQGRRPVWVEDESENLGRVNIPRVFFRQLREAPLLLMEVSRRARAARVLEEYALFPRSETADALDRIRKRLGGLAHKRAHACLAADDLAGLADILLDYYDRAYAGQLAGRNILGTIHADEPDEAAEQIGWMFGGK